MVKSKSTIKKFRGVRGLSGLPDARNPLNGVGGTDETLWSDLGMSRASKKDRAEVWRQALQGDLEDWSAGDSIMHPSLLPVLPDIEGADDMDPQTIAVIRAQRPLTDAEAHRLDWDYFRDQLEEQIANASDAQIIAYGDTYFALATALKG